MAASDATLSGVVADCELTQHACQCMIARIFPQALLRPSVLHVGW
jgi:hypothetical protein